MSRRVTARTRPRPRTDTHRRRAARESLIASGVAPAPMLPTYDMLYGNPGHRYFLEQALAAGNENFNGDRWPCDAQALDVTEAVFRDGSSAVFRTPGGALAHVRLSDGWIHVHVAALDPAAIGPVFAAFRTAYPASYMTQEADPRVPITFWANSQFGPTARLRKVDSALWADIVGNYTADVEVKLGDLMAWENGPPNNDGGQLVLWQGPPGTGKSWALRALASEWAPWAEFHYITDPDSFFVDDPSYMINVLLADSYEAIDEPTGDVYSEQRDGKWRILILEDTGELLSANAKEKYGQGLSRLLNVVDGMIGQGLKVLALVTTNDELGDLHPAVVRPGRCASQIEFGPLTDDEARAWTGDPDATSGTLAELYAIRGAVEEAFAEEDPEDGWDENELRAAIYAVADQHAESAVGYGETAWHEEDRAVLYVSGDWTDTDPIEADFLAIDGVDEFRHEAEALPSGWWSAEVVYPENPPRWVTQPPEADEATLADTVALALEPLALPRPPDEPKPVVAAAPAQPSPDAAFAHRALDVLERFASRPADPAPTVNLHLPTHALSIAVERQAPDVHVDATTTLEEGAVRVEAPIDVHVPEQAPPIVQVAAADPAPIVVQMPEQTPTPVHVTVEQPPRASALRVETDESGTKRFVIE